MGDKDLLSDKVTIKQKCWIFNMKTAVKVTKGQIWSGTISKKLMLLGVLLVWKISYLCQTVQSWYYATLPSCEHTESILFNYINFLFYILLEKFVERK